MGGEGELRQLYIFSYDFDSHTPYNYLIHNGRLIIFSAIKKKTLQNILF